jgi:hypothetical protein
MRKRSGAAARGREIASHSVRLEGSDNVEVRIRRSMEAKMEIGVAPSPVASRFARRRRLAHASRFSPRSGSATTTFTLRRALSNTP